MERCSALRRETKMEAAVRQSDVSTVSGTVRPQQRKEHKPTGAAQSPGANARAY